MMTWTARKRGCLDRLGGLVVSDGRQLQLTKFYTNLEKNWNQLIFVGVAAENVLSSTHSSAGTERILLKLCSKIEGATVLPTAKGNWI